MNLFYFFYWTIKKVLMFYELNRKYLPMTKIAILKTDF